MSGMVLMSGMSVGKILGNPPALDAAIGQRGTDLDDPAFVRSLLHDIRQQVDPGFGRDIRLALLGHRGDCRNGVANGDLGTDIRSLRSE